LTAPCGVYDVEVSLSDPDPPSYILTFHYDSPFIFIGVNEIVHENIKFAADTELIVKNDFSKFLHSGIN
jgi:hypothetical protein